MSVPTRVTTIRLPEELADLLDVVARVDGVTASHAIRTAIAEYVDRRKADAVFRTRLADRIEADQKILERLRS
jgi:predicted transcriptional regulator